MDLAKEESDALRRVFRFRLSNSDPILRGAPPQEVYLSGVAQVLSVLFIVVW
jgi:hypothetical protein